MGRGRDGFAGLAQPVEPEPAPPRIGQGQRTDALAEVRRGSASVFGQFSRITWSQRSSTRTKLPDMSRSSDIRASRCIAPVSMACHTRGPRSACGIWASRAINSSTAPTSSRASINSSSKSGRSPRSSRSRRISRKTFRQPAPETGDRAFRLSPFSKSTGGRPASSPIDASRHQRNRSSSESNTRACAG